jgi:hypothetical protein
VIEAGRKEGLAVKADQKLNFRVVPVDYCHGDSESRNPFFVCIPVVLTSNSKMNHNFPQPPKEHAIEQEDLLRLDVPGGGGGMMKPTTTTPPERHDEQTEELTPELRKNLDEVLEGLHNVVIHLCLSYFLGIVMVCFDMMDKLAPIYCGYMFVIFFYAFQVIRPPLKSLIVAWEPLRETIRCLRQNMVMMVLHPIQFWFGSSSCWMTFSWHSTSGNGSIIIPMLEDLCQLKDTLLRFLFCQPPQPVEYEIGENSEDSCRCLVDEESSQQPVVVLESDSMGNERILDDKTTSLYL